jgi:hypothetical protein
MAAALLIFLYVRHENSYDRFHEHADRIQRLTMDMSTFGTAARAFGGAAP